MKTPAFHHCVYVVRCADNSLYTGYAPDVEARIRAHNQGKGAKYTKSRRPVQLVACARFYSKERALSAEYHFKQLDRAKKEALLELAQQQPFEQVIGEHVPHFGTESALEFVGRSLAQNKDEAYQAFQAKLIPGIPSARIVGVRTPVLRKTAAQLMKMPDAAVFLKKLPHALFEENQIHAFAIGCIKDYDQLIRAYETFLPYVDNWASCDQLPTKPLMQRPDETLQHCREWMQADRPYTVRFGIEVLMQWYLKDLFNPEFLDWVANVPVRQDGKTRKAPSDDYYVAMMKAWFFAEALAWQEDAVLPWLEGTRKAAHFDEWTRKKAIRKALESFKVDDQLKERLRGTLSCK